MEEIGSLRILGSNTEVNFFNETTDQQNVFLKKNELYFLNSNFVSNLNLTKYSADSVEIESIAGNSDTLLLMTKTGLQIYFPQIKKTNQLKNYNFSICDKMAILDSFVVVSNGNTNCQPNIVSKVFLFKINAATELLYLNDFQSDPIIDTKVLNRKIVMLSSSGSLGVYEIKNGEELVRRSEKTIEKAEFFRVFPNSNKILVKSPSGISQFKVLPDFSLEKINEI
ncbi:hypothetical protein EGI22_20385 [Lacihabitans sp. LS3-19]|uniref:hypothetical protein n=1 Tax=Lacihabitans sp. LS3-19 TaxID=2487335 RepID=UPI0020CBE3F7|nr:hypothetical protein [Lacihabitans sp. LS3-19]MCP9770270.1 hypothetical protein [Lacihabitans sp. LS3-19]